MLKGLHYSVVGRSLGLVSDYLVLFWVFAFTLLTRFHFEKMSSKMSKTIRRLSFGCFASFRLIDAYNNSDLLFSVKVDCKHQLAHITPNFKILSWNNDESA
jgi:hypothetical protein